MKSFDDIYKLIHKSRGLIRRELRKSGSSGTHYKEIWCGVEPTEEIIEDLIQESALEVWRCMESFDETKASLSTWVGRIIKGRVLNYKKFQSRRVSLAPDEHEPSGGDNPSGVMEMVQGLEKITDKERAMLDLYMGGCPEEEIAIIVGSTPQSVKQQFSGIKKKLDGRD